MGLVEVIELGRVITAFMCDTHGPEIIVRGERTKALYQVFVHLVRVSEGEKPLLLTPGDRCVIERGSYDPQVKESGAFYISRWVGDDVPMEEEMRGWIGVDPDTVPVLGPCLGRA